MVRLSVVLAIAVAGCGSPNATLADLPELHVQITANRRDADAIDDAFRPSELSAYLFYDVDAFRAARGPDACAVVGDDIDVTFGDIRFELDDPGHGYDDGGCIDPMFSATALLDTVGGGRLVVADATHDVVADYPIGAVAARIASPVSDPDWHFAAGATITLAWSSAADLANSSMAYFDGPGASGMELGVVVTAPPEFQLVFPDPSPVTGDGSVDIWFGSSDSGDATTCAGATRCSYANYLGYRHAASID